MPFNIKKCLIPTVYCGDGNDIPERNINDEFKYISLGSRNQCMKKGFGAGMYSQINKSIPIYSLQKIKYVGKKYESNFNQENIFTIDQLEEYIERHTKNEFKILLKKVFVKSNNILDKKAYNSLLMFMHKRGHNHLPSCKEI